MDRIASGLLSSSFVLKIAKKNNTETQKQTPPLEPNWKDFHYLKMCKICSLEQTLGLIN